MFYLLLIFDECLTHLLLRSSFGLGDSGSIYVCVWCRHYYLATGSVYIICLIIFLTFVIYSPNLDQHHIATSWYDCWLVWRMRHCTRVWQWYTWDCAVMCLECFVTANWFSMALQFLFVFTMSFYCLFSVAFTLVLIFICSFHFMHTLPPSSHFKTALCVSEERGCWRIVDGVQQESQCEESKVRTMFIIWLYFFLSCHLFV